MLSDGYAVLDLDVLRVPYTINSYQQLPVQF
jgi:hypothetical protein